MLLSSMSVRYISSIFPLHLLGKTKISSLTDIIHVHVFILLFHDCKPKNACYKYTIYILNIELILIHFCIFSICEIIVSGILKQGEHFVLFW